MRVYKFLSKKWALDALRNRRLKIARLDELNDPFDLSPFDTSTHLANLMMTLTLNDMAKRFGFVCFSARWTDPVIWAHYAELAEVIVGMRGGTCRREVERCLSDSEADSVILRAAAAPTGFGVIAATDQLRNHDDLTYYLKRGDTFHPVQFVIG
jgi:hypothetical protein